MTPVAREWTTHAIGGAAVLGTYAWGAGQPNIDALWGRLPVEAIGPYTACMPFAAIGYLVTMAWSLRRTRRGEAPWSPTFAMILAASAAWLPLCFVDLASPSRAGWWLIQADLATTAVGALILLRALWSTPREGALHAAARVGWIAFCVQTVALDALIWPQFFGVT